MGTTMATLAVHFVYFPANTYFYRTKEKRYVRFVFRSKFDGN